MRSELDAAEFDFPRFTFARYAADHAFGIVIAIFCICGVACCLPLLGVNASGTFLITIFIFACTLLFAVVDFARKRKYYRRLVELMGQLDEAIGVDSMLEEPSFLEARIHCATVEQLLRLYSAQLASIKEETDAYRRYIELWIHEIKTPIAAIRLMLAKHNDETSHKIAKEIERVESQVDQALYYARSTSVASDYTIKEVALGESIREACKRNARFMIENSTVPSICIDDDVRVLTDEAWLIFMLGQLIVNASKYGASKIDFSVQVNEEGTAQGNTVLEIRDDGCGIPACDVPRVFDRGFTGVVGREHGSATGMGLYLVARLCHSLGLHVGLASEEGVGTRVMITFPHDRTRKRLLLQND